MGEPVAGNGQGTANPQPSQSQQQTALITEQEARDLVLAQVPGASIVKFKQDTDDGRTVYDGKAVLEGREYEFEIDAATGSFLEWDADDADEGWCTGGGTASGQAVQTAMDEEGARALVLARIPGATIVEIERDTDNGRVCYEGEAVLDGREYEFEIDATAGEFIKWEADNR